MKPAGRGPLRSRERSRGVAVIELALSLVFLIPLLMGMLDFGYYFYVASNVEQAARVGVRQAVLDGGGVCPGGATKADVEAYATSTGAGCNTAGGGDAACYLHQAPMSLGTSTNLTVTATCLKPPAAPLDPTWQVQVQADFPLAYGFFKALFPQSTRTTGWVKYTATATSD